jgi:hypothetical protein
MEAVLLNYLRGTSYPEECGSVYLRNLDTHQPITSQFSYENVRSHVFHAWLLFQLFFMCRIPVAPDRLETRR